MVVDFVSNNPKPVICKPALAVLPAPPLVEDTAPLVFVYVPPLPVTSTLTVQVPPPVIEPLLKLRLVSPFAGAKIGVLEALHPNRLTLGESATQVPVGNASVKATPVNVVVGFGLVIVNVNVDVCPMLIVLGLKALAIAGGATTTSNVACAVLPVPALAEVTAPLVFR